MNRDQVIAEILSASTFEECRHAQELLAQWMREHPDDLSMLDAGESLEMTREGLEPAVAEKPLSEALA